MESLRVLVFSATFGAGHLRAAEAVIEAIQTTRPDAEITHLDCGTLLSKTFNTLLKGVYLEMIRRAPKLWGRFYHYTARISPDSTMQQYLNKMGRTELLKTIRFFNPDLIVCTYPTAAGVLAQLRLNHTLDIPLVTVVTDYAVHSQWVHQGVDQYVVGCEDVYQGLVSRGLDPGRIHLTGIPVNPKFEYPLDRAEITAKLGLNPEYPTVLVMGGAFGILSGIKRVCRFLTQTGKPVQPIVVCGRNEKLYKSLDTIAEQARNPLHRYGYVDNVEELMTAADMIITKAGGLIVSEALTKRLPLIIFKPIPGQEEENAAFISKSGAGKVVDTFADLTATVDTLLKHPPELEKMRRAAAKILPGLAAERAVQHMLRLVSTDVDQKKIG